MVPYDTVYDLATGGGPLVVEPGADIRIRFQPAEVVDFCRVESFSVYLISSDQTQLLPALFFLYDFYDHTWRAVDSPRWGENIIDSAWRFVSPDGDVYLQIPKNSLVTRLSLDKITVMYTILTAQTGNVVLYGTSH